MNNYDETDNIPIDINKPSYYVYNNFELIDVIREAELNFNLGNVAKYIFRAGRKDAHKKIEDLQKARNYLIKEIEYLEADIFVDLNKQ
jgi:hypothetical protein